MFKFKKTAAFLMCLLMCGSMTAFQRVSAEVTDDSENGDIFVDENGNQIVTESEESEIKQSGDFLYSTDGETVKIEDCTSKETEIVVPEEIEGLPVTELGETAFGKVPEDSVAEKIVLPSSINYISADNPFIYCIKLKEIAVDEKNENYVSVDGVLYSKDMTTLVCYPDSKSGKSYTVDSKTTTLGVASIYYTELESVILPSGLENISRYALSCNERIKSIDMSSTKVTEIGDFAFTGCTLLTDCKLSSTLQKIGGGAFSNCSNLEDIELPLGLLSIGQSAFANTELPHVIIPESVQDIGYSAFGYSITPGGMENPDANFFIVGKQGSAAQRYCTDSDNEYGYRNEFTFMTYDEYEKREELFELEILEDGIFKYAVIDGGAAIAGCSSQETSIVIPDKIGGYPVTELLFGSFTDCFASEITFPDTLKTVKEGAFYGCQYIHDIVLPQSVTEVEGYVFGNCPSLVSVDLGGAEHIGEKVFEECPKLEKIVIPGNCKTIDGDEPFITYNTLKEISVSDGDGNYSSQDGVLYNKEKTVLIAYPASKEGTSFTVPASVKTIEQSAFAYANFLETVDLSSVEEIKDCAFEKCSMLKKVKMSKELVSIGVDAFFNCKELKSMRFYDKVENFGEYAVGYCYNETADAENGETTDALVLGFKIYADKNSVAYDYAKANKIITVTDTVEIKGHNVSKPFLIVCGALFAALIIAVIIVISVKNRKKKAADGKIKPKKKPSEKEEKGEKTE